MSLNSNHSKNSCFQGPRCFARRVQDFRSRLSSHQCRAWRTARRPGYRRVADAYLSVDDLSPGSRWRSQRTHLLARLKPTVSALKRRLGALEDTPPAVCFATGMAAISAIFLALLKSGDHVVLSDVVYGGTVRLFDQVLGHFGVESSFVDTADPAAVKAAIKPATRMVFIETPANPTLKLTDIAAIAAITRPAGLLLAVDNTFLTPVLQRPLDLGADITLLSTTKYIEGHNSTVGGSIAARDETLLERLRLVRKTLGCIQSPQEAWLTARGIKTLPLRLQQHSAQRADCRRVAGAASRGRPRPLSRASPAFPSMSWRNVSTRCTAACWPSS